jgi:alanyl-tRNA synthetase
LKGRIDVSILKLAEVRAAFLDYFARQGHHSYPSAPLVPRDDPTLLFVNAGMVPFKDVFTGDSPLEVKRAASSQRCLRVSGKHNDLEEVGRTPRHHTFFEMLGNFSFGDYFKQDAIRFAHEFLVDELRLDPQRLAYTVFGGAAGIPADEEAAELWQRITGCPPERVLRFGMKDNFWAMGETGPCGPCSEIHYDLGPELAGEVNRGDRWMEIWNLVFMQYQRDESGELKPLPAPSIDTGMGLERIASVVQGKFSNYDTDLFLELLEHIASVTGRPYRADGGDDAVSMRVIADHVRAAVFLLADDVHPDRTGRGYVLRKIMRRAISHGVLLGVHDNFLADVASRVAELMGEAYPVLHERLPLIRRGIEGEETLFRRTVELGMRRIDDLLQQLADERVWLPGEGDTRVLSGEAAFRLYDTYGCPLELTASVGVRRGFAVDEAGFAAAMDVQKERSRASWKGDGSARGAVDAFFADRRDELAATRFLGYETERGESTLTELAIVGEKELKSAERAGEGTAVALVTEATPFYGESGGQVGDTGEIVPPRGSVRIEDTRRVAGGEVFVHLGTVTSGEIARGESVELRVDTERRRRIACHHSATHLMHHALREVLGKHVQQKGSFVGPDRLRFDFSHPDPLSPAELLAVEDRVNALIRKNSGVAANEMSFAQAEKAGALAFFDEKYGDRVRVVRMGESQELCGGTHVDATGELGYFLIGSEGSIASGVRRIEAYCGPAAVAHAREAQRNLLRAAEVLKSSPADVLEKLGDLQEELRRMRRRVEELESAATVGLGADLARKAVDVAGHRVIVGRAPVETRDALRDLGDRLRASGPATVVVLGAEMDGKVAFVAAVSDDLVKAGRVRAGDLVGRIARVASGGGGGKPHLATAGAKDPAKLDEALAAVPAVLAEILGG